MKLNSLLLIVIYGGVFSVVAASFLKEEAAASSCSKSLSFEDDDEFILVEADVVGANSPIESPFYPKLENREDIDAELARIKDNFENGKMTEATTIDLLVLVYQAFNAQVGTLESTQTVLNETFQLIIEFPDIAYSYIMVYNFSKDYRQLINLHRELIEKIRAVDITYYDAIQIKYRNMVYHDFSKKMFEIKTIDGVKAIFDRVDILPIDSPIKLLSSVPMNLNLKNYLRFFMCVYAMSLQCKYIISKDNYTDNDFNMIFYDSTAIFLRAFPKESDSSEIANILLSVFNYSRAMIVGAISKGYLSVRHFIKECMKFGLSETVSLIMTLEESSKTNRPQIVSLLEYAANILQFKIFTKLYQDWSSNISLEDKCLKVLKAAVSKPGVTNFINEHLAEKFSKEEWKVLLKEATENMNMSAVKALLRISLLDYNVLYELGLDLNSIFDLYLSNPRNYNSDADVIDVIYLLPIVTIQASSFSNHYPILGARFRSGHFDGLKAKFHLLLVFAQNNDFSKVEFLFADLFQYLVPYYVRKLLSRLNLNNCPRLAHLILENIRSKSAYIEEAAYGAMESLNLGLLQILVNYYAFKITDTFAKRWAIKCDLESNYANILEFQTIFANNINSIYVNGPEN